MQAPLVSIVIAAYNRPAELATAIESASRQSYPEVEVIVVDDGSGPEVEQLVARMMALDSRIRFHRHNSNQGNRAARHQGALMAQGEFVMFLDDDDLIHLEKIRLQMEAFEAEPSLDVVGCQTRLFFRSIGDSPFVWNTLKTECGLVERFLMHWHPWSMCAPLYRRNALLRASVYGAPECELLDKERSRGEDFELASRTLIAGARGTTLPYELCFARQHQGVRESVISEVERARDYAKLFGRLADLVAASSLRDDERCREALRQSLLWTGLRLLETDQKGASLDQFMVAKQWVPNDRHAEIMDILIDAVASGGIDGPKLRAGLPEMKVDLARREGWWMKVRAADEDLLPVPKARRYRRESF